MADVLKIALDRRAELHEEIAKLDEFIRIAEGLIRSSQDGGSTEPSVTIPGLNELTMGDEDHHQRPTTRRVEPAPSVTTEISRPSVIRRGAATGG